MDCLENLHTLADTGLPKEVQDLVLDQLTLDVYQLQLIVKKLGGDGSSIAIRDEDFPLLREIATGVASVWAGTAFHAWAPAALASLIVMLYTFRKKGICLNPSQGAVLRELKRSPSGLSAEDLATLLNQPIENVVKELSALESISRNDGVRVSLVTPDTGERWRTTDL